VEVNGNCVSYANVTAPWPIISICSDGTLPPIDTVKPGSIEVIDTFNIESALETATAELIAESVVKPVAAMNLTNLVDITFTQLDLTFHQYPSVPFISVG